MQRHIPDFNSALLFAKEHLSYPTQSGEPFWLWPTGLQLAKDENDTPILTLERLRGQVLDEEMETYGRFSFELDPIYNIEAVLPQLRQAFPNRAIAPFVITSGQLRFYSNNPNTPLPDALQQPVALGWNGLQMIYRAIRLDEAATLWVKGLIEQGVVDIKARATVELEGYAPRLPIKATFDPSELLADVVAYVGKRPFTWQLLNEYFQRPVSSLPLTLSAPVAPEDDDRLSQAFTDRIYARFGTLSADIHLGDSPRIGLSTHAPGQFEWDLATWEVVRRPLVLQFDPSQAIQTFVQANDAEAFLSTVSVPTVPSGTLRVQVNSQSPPNCINALAYGITLKTPSNLPRRLAETRQGRLKAGRSQLALDLKFLRSETPSYTAVTYLVFRSPNGVRKIEQAVQSDDDGSLYLYPGDFPGRIMVLQASPRLLTAVSSLSGYYDIDGTQINFSLSPKKRVITVVLAENEPAIGTFTITAVSKENGREISTSPLTAPVYLDFASFDGYGPQQIEINYDFAQSPNGGFAVYEFQAENQSEATTLFFSSSAPTKQFTYLPDSPFNGRYRFRPRNGDWSAWQSQKQLTLPTLPVRQIETEGNKT